MKKLFILFALMMVAVVSVTAQKNAMAAKETTEAALMRMENEIADGLLKGDVSAFDKYVSDKATLVDPTGMRSTKAASIKLFTTGALKFELMTVSDLKVTMFGSNTAIVSYITTDKGMFKDPATGHEMKIDSRTQWTDTFLNMNGKWLCVATQGTTIMEAPKY